MPVYAFTARLPGAPGVERSGWLVLSAVGLLLLALFSPTSADDRPDNTPAGSGESFQEVVQPFLKQYCVECHAGEKPKADRRLDQLGAKLRSSNDLADFQDILDQLNLGEMPPPDSPQPSSEQRQRVIDWFTAEIQAYHKSASAERGEVVLRRLNAREYTHSVRDLLHLNMTMFNPTAGFPRDQTEDHLDNQGATLVTSGYLLQKYLDAADRIVDKAVYPVQQPPVRKWFFKDGFQQQPEIDQVHRFTNKFEHMTLYEVVGADKHEGAYGAILAFAKGVPVDGYYDIRFQAEALNRNHPYDAEFLGMDREERFRLGIVPGDQTAGQLHKPQAVEPLLAEVELADDRKKYSVRVWLDAGYTPRFTFRNGPIEIRELYSRLIKKYPDLFPGVGTGIVAVRRAAIEHGQLPQIRIDEIEIEGPFYESWPRASQRASLGQDCESILNTGEMTPEQMRGALTEFMNRAYRRPVETAEVDRVMKVIQRRQESGRSSLEAYTDGLKTVLCSPRFLYLDEPGSPKLDSYALASRLAYFLWASTPDDELLAAAASGALQQESALLAQVERMLQDPRSDDFLTGFLGSWLTLNELGSQPPDRNAFKPYYQYELDRAMRQETFLFTRHLLDENLSVVNFLHSDFTFVNKPLARLYEVASPQGNGFEKVRLTNRRRGGLLGQASVLTVSANGIDTSPVVRGVWLLENILGTPPAPPPADVKPLDPDIRGAKSIREQLQLHRDTPACNSCHRKIDPPGFALENFDPIGRWRESYGKAGRIDASGEMSEGESCSGVEEFKTILLNQQEQFTRAITTKLLAYALGRPLEPLDRPHVDRIVAELQAQGNGLRDLVRLIVLSEPFQRP